MARLARAVLLVADLLHPIDVLPVQAFVDGHVGHRGRCRCPMPVFKVRWKPDDIARPHLFDRPAFALHPTGTGGDDQSLTEWMRMPSRARTWLERDARCRDAARIAYREKRIDTDRAREILGWPFCRRLGTHARYFHLIYPFVCT